jgi:hypothetical protein
LGRSTLEKPELTYCYIQKLMTLMISLGLDYETVPLSFFGIYLMKFIIKNQNYELLEKMKLKRVLTKCRHPLQESIKINFSEFKITEEELNEEMSHVKCQKVSQNAEENGLEANAEPNLIQPLSNYRYWYLAGVTLLDFAEISTAKVYFN